MSSTISSSSSAAVANQPPKPPPHSQHSHQHQQTQLQLQLPPFSWGLLLCHIISLLFAVIVLKAAYAFETKESAMAFYGVYHRKWYIGG